MQELIQEFSSSLNIHESQAIQIITEIAEKKLKELKRKQKLLNVVLNEKNSPKPIHINHH